MSDISGVNTARLEELIDRFAGRRVALLVDLVVDEFVHGEIARVSREAPVLILEHRTTEVVPGGGGNAAANLRALDAEPLPVGVVGTDESGTRLLASFEERGIDTRAVLRAADYATPTKSRILAGGVHTRRQQVVRIDRGAAHGALPSTLTRALLERLRGALPRAEGLLVADYGYGSAPPDLVREALGSRGRRELPVTVDSRGRVAAFHGITACTPNQEELERALDTGPLSDGPALEAAGRELLRRCRARALLLTRGARGMSLFEPDREALHVAPFGSDEVADVTGAGDTVIAVFSLALLAGGTFAEAAVLANCAAGLVVMKAGTATVGREELRRALREGPR